MIPRRAVLMTALAVLTVATTAAAQGRRGAPPAPAKPRNGTVERITLAGGEATVYLPPSYTSDAARRFPVVYLISDRTLESLKLPASADTLAAAPGFSEPIVVKADAAAVENLPAEIDTRYRTIAERISRGLAGVSLGGDAALRLAMRKPDVFSSVYLLSASIVDATVASIETNVSSLQRLYDIALNVGTRDAALAMNRRLHDTMTRLKIGHYYEEFDGTLDTATDRVETRLLPFFSKNLKAPANPTSPAVN